MHPELRRVAAVFGAIQGSGYLLTEQLILTSGHLLNDYGEAAAIVPHGTGKQSCRVVWRGWGESRDAALLWAEQSLVGEESLGADPEWAVVQDLQVWPGARAVGYPHVQRQGADLESHQIVGRFNPATGAFSDGAVLEDLDQPTGRSPWAGMSGAAVFAEGLLAGVVRADPASWEHGRLEIVPAWALATERPFIEACTEAGHKIRKRTLMVVGQGRALSFEQALRDYIATQVDEVHITGLRLGSDVDGDSDGEDQWSLQRSYVDLRFAARGSAGSGLANSGLAESVLAGPRRVLVLGGAGSGKTMLLQWLASISARRIVPAHLADLADRIPLLLSLRTLVNRGLPGPEEFLETVAWPLAGHSEATGWVSEQMRLGRVLLLVDGLDEVAKEDRERVRLWLGNLIKAFPSNRYVATSRPAAIPAGWLKKLGFVEVEAQPMTTEEISAVVTNWFAAVGQIDDSPWLREARQAVIAGLRENPDIAALAMSPLMCALICALTYRGGQVRRWSRTGLYTDALDLLLERRDVGRGIGTDIRRLSRSQQSRLLGCFAYWLSLEGATELHQEQALTLVRGEMPRFGWTDPNTDPQHLLRFLLISSGVLRETPERTIRFIHLPFQSFLTAQMALEEDHIGLLIKNAHDEEWTEILTLAAAQATAEKCEKLLRGLLHQRLKDPPHADRIAAVAKSCLEFAEQHVDPDLRKLVLATAGS